MTTTAQTMTTFGLGRTGRTRRRVADRRFTLDRPVRIGPRTDPAACDWEHPPTGPPDPDGGDSVYLSYYPDRAALGAAAAVAFARLAVAGGVARLALLAPARARSDLPVTSGVPR